MELESGEGTDGLLNEEAIMRAVAAELGMDPLETAEGVLTRLHCGQAADGSPGEHFVGTQASGRVAGQEKDQPMFQQADAGAFLVSCGLLDHLVENGGGAGEVGAQAFGIGRIDPAVVLLGADGQAQVQALRIDPGLLGPHTGGPDNQPGRRLLRHPLHLVQARPFPLRQVTQLLIPGQTLFQAPQQALGRSGAISLVEVAALCIACPIEDMVAQIQTVLPQARVTALRQAVTLRMEMVGQLRRFSWALSAVVLVIGIRSAASSAPTRCRCSCPWARRATSPGWWT